VAEILGEEPKSSSFKLPKLDSLAEPTADGQEVIIGLFDGQEMVGPDGQKYTVPPNYASKSKLIPGDQLKLIIKPSGEYLYKQIKPVPRVHLKGVLKKDEQSKNFYVLAEGRDYRVLTASVTYFKGEPGDEAIIIVPESKDSQWAAVENIIHEPSALAGSDTAAIISPEHPDKADLASLSDKAEAPLSATDDQADKLEEI